MDVETGIIEKVRRQVTLGDAFAPTVAAIIIGLGGILLLLERTPSDLQQPDNHTNKKSLSQHLCMADALHAIVVLLVVAVSLWLMRYVGPFVLSVVEGDTAEYRLLRDTVPWKYLGFIAGGVWLIVSLIAMAERRVRWQHFVIALLAVIILIAFYDIPFDDLLLPPNGDV